MKRPRSAAGACGLLLVAAGSVTIAFTASATPDFVQAVGVLFGGVVATFGAAIALGLIETR